MNSKRLHLILSATILLLLIALIGGAYSINSHLTTQSDNLNILKAKSLALQQQQVALVKAKKDITTYADLQKITKAIVPEDKNQAEAVRQIVKLASDDEIILQSITFPASTLGNSPIGAKPTPAAANAVPSASTNKSNDLSQLQVVKDIPGVYLLPIVVQSDTDRPVPYDKFIKFLGAVEHNRRTAQVSNIAIAPDVKDRSLLTFTLTLNEYIKP